MSDVSFQEEITSWYPALLRFAHSLCRTRADADDLTNETVCRALERSHQFQRGTNLKAWLFTIMRNRFYTNIRSRNTAEAYAETLHETLHPQDVGELPQLAHLKYAEVRAGLARLTIEERKLLILATIEELPYETLAAMFEVEPGTIKSRVHRIREKLRRFSENPEPNTASPSLPGNRDTRTRTPVRLGVTRTKRIDHGPVQSVPAERQTIILGDTRLVLAETIIVAQATPHQRTVQVFRLD